MKTPERKLEEFYELGDKLVEERGWERVVYQGSILGYVDRHNDCRFLTTDPTSFSSRLKAMRKALRGERYQTTDLDNQKKSGSAGKASFSDWFAEQRFDGMQLDGDNKVISSQYPELYVLIRNTKNTDAAQKQINGLSVETNNYHNLILLLQSNGVTRQQQDDGVHLVRKEGNIDVKLVGDYKNVTKSVAKLQTRLAKEQEQVAAKPAQLSNVSSTTATEEPDTQLRMDAAQPMMTPHMVAKAAPGAKESESKKITYKIPSRVDPLSSQRGYSVHDEIYDGEVPAIGPNSRVLFLDANVLMHFFGMGRKGQKETENLRRAETFGEKVFASMLNAPGLDAIIIPDYVLDTVVKG